MHCKDTHYFIKTKIRRTFFCSRRFLAYTALQQSNCARQESYIIVTQVPVPSVISRSRSLVMQNSNGCCGSSS